MRRTRGRCTYSKTIGRLILLACITCFCPIFAQNSIPDSIKIKAVPVKRINSNSSEYSPFRYKNKFYFVSDRENDFAVIYYDAATSHQFSDLYKAKYIDTLKIRRPSAISNQFKTKYYIGPSCETEVGFYCTVNNAHLLKEKKRLPLQINFLEKDKRKKLMDPVKITFGLSDTVSCAQPSVWKDSIMFMASDLFYETGKIDLFYSLKIDNQWQTPISCGSKVNTEYNEVFPFYTNGTLYFSSDRPNGLGGLDIYKINIFEEDAKLELLSNPINSKYDDFGVYIDSTQLSGYFSSSRKGNDDIYYFNTIVPAFEDCQEMKSNNYCFTFFEEASIETTDTTGMTYEWSFGDGSKKRGLEVSHCFDGEGIYLVELNVVDKSSGQVFFNEISYEFEINNIVQIYIQSPDSARPKTDIAFDPSYTNIDSLNIKKYYWDFGDGTYSFEEKPNHKYDNEGSYLVKLGLDGTRAGKKFKQCATKTIVISNKITEPVFAFKPPIKHVPPIDYQKMLMDSLEKHEKEFYDFIVKKNKEDSIENANNEIAVLVKEIKEESEVGISPVIAKDDKYKSISNVYAFNEKDSSTSYKVHIGISKDLLIEEDSAFQGLSEISNVKIDSMYHYFYGNTKTLTEILPYYKRSLEEGFNSSVVSMFKKQLLLENPNLKNQFLMQKDTIKKGETRISNKPIEAIDTTVIDEKEPIKENNTKEIKPIKNTDKTVVKTNNTKEEVNNNIPTGNRVEIATYKKKQDLSKFKNIGNVIEVKGKDGKYTYISEDVKSAENAKELKAALIELGYKDAKIVGETLKNLNTDTKLDKPKKLGTLEYGSGPIAYRVQIGAYKTQKPLSDFSKLKGAVSELKTLDGYFKYVTEDVKTLENALDLQSALLSMGYRNSFVTAYEGGKRIPLIESILAGLSVYFNLDSYKVLPSEMDKIDYYFKKYANKSIKEIELEGNTCNLGSNDYNFKLSERRVLAVEEALKPYVKVTVNRKFLGEFYPLYNNSSEFSRKRNRRVDVVILE